MSRLCQCGVLSHSNSIVTLRALPTLVRLCKAHGDVPVNTQAAHTLGKYVHYNMSSNAHSSYSQGVLDVLLVCLSSYLLAKSTKSLFSAIWVPPLLYHHNVKVLILRERPASVQSSSGPKVETVSCLLHLPPRLANYRCKSYALRRDLGKRDVDKPLLAHAYMYVCPGLLYHKETLVLIEGKDY